MRYAKAKSWTSSIALAKPRRVPHLPGYSTIASTAMKSVGYPAVDTLPTEKRHGMRAFWLDGLFASLAVSFVEPYQTLFLLSLYATNAQIGLFNTLIQFIGAITALPGAVLADRTGRYKQVWLAAGFASRALWLIILVAPWVLPVRSAVWMVLVAGVGVTGVTVLGTPAWTALAAELVPIKVRGSFFASRNMIMHLAQLFAIPAAGLLINHIGEPGGYQASFGLAFAFGMISLLIFRQLPEHSGDASINHHNLRQTFQAAIRMPTYMRFLVAHSTMNFGVWVGAPFINVYLVQEAQLRVSTIGFATTAGVLASLIGMRILGRLHDRHGILWTMRFGLIVPLVPIAHLWVSQPWHAHLISVISALTWVGYNLGAFNLLLASTPDEHRPYYIALHTTIVSVAGALGPLLGGGLLDIVGYGAVFGLSGLARAMGLVLLFALVHEPEGESTELLPDAV